MGATHSWQWCGHRMLMSSHSSERLLPMQPQVHYWTCCISFTSCMLSRPWREPRALVMRCEVSVHAQWRTCAEHSRHAKDEEQWAFNTNCRRVTHTTSKASTCRTRSHSVSVSCKSSSLWLLALSCRSCHARYSTNEFTSWHLLVGTRQRVSKARFLPPSILEHIEALWMLTTNGPSCQWAVVSGMNQSEGF